ncbi:uncharacterized protein AFUA_3G12610 [Aspergillus fumigatus Af293]|uniref:Uncharacterized protein n=2 Tax=Aspergillus fumigatus TaxID=746128 RepID=Q4WYD1_ASPFU|nr:conserved hypothetical protein [Aspergillus fumigatus Af293]EAL92322.1 conserved hypothetical protein [Aspergillus fumigatus Af293]
MFKSDLPVIKVSSYFCGSKTNRCNENKCEEGLPLLQNPSAPIWAVLQSEAAFSIASTQPAIATTRPPLFQPDLLNPQSKMANAEQERQQILTSLSHIFWSNTDVSTGITHKPYGVDWINFERNMYRLCVLQGKVRDGDKVPEDPWEMFLRELAPLTKRPAGQPQPSTAYFPTSILRSSVGNANANASGGPSAGQDGQHHVRFEVPLLRRSDENRRNVGRIPRYLN